MAEEEETQEVSVTFSKEFIEESMGHYPAATRPSQAVRMGYANDVERKEQSITPATIRDSVIEALERAGGGKFENVQRIVVGNVDQLELENIGDIQVVEAGDE